MEKQAGRRGNRRERKRRDGRQTTFNLTTRDFETIEFLCQYWDEPTMCGVIRRLVQLGGLIADYQRQGWQLQLTDFKRTVVLAVPKPLSLPPR